MKKSKAYSHDIPNASEFEDLRESWRIKMGDSRELREKAIQLTIASNEFLYGYQWEWCGVPIIRHPDDIVLQQEIVWKLRPTRIVETGVARGGSLVLSACLLEICGIKGRVLGLDIEIMQHAIDSLKPWLARNRIEVLECDSASKIAVESVRNFLNDDVSPALLILDSNHSHEHVLSELSVLGPLLPRGSIVIVTDTIIQEMPDGYYPDRPWGRGNNPRTAIIEFLNSNPEFEIDSRWSRRSLMGECRDGILIKK